MRRPELRVSHHRGTTAHVCSIYPFSVQPSLSVSGLYIGVDLLAGGAGFCWDPFEAYNAGLVTNPNTWVLGEPGNGKSALVKCLLWRMAAVYRAGPERRWIAVVDPKGEYTALADALGLSVVKLTPGGSVRLNPLADGPLPADEAADQVVLRRAEMVAALVATVLDRPLTQVEDTGLFAVVEQLAETKQTATLADLISALVSPTDAICRRLQLTANRASNDLAPVKYALDKLLSRSLRGMFDGSSTIASPWSGDGLLLDLSAIPLDSEALPLVMVAAAGWLQQMMVSPGPKRVQVLDEAWALLANRHTTRFLQSSFKLGRAYGIANICVTHRASDLTAQADDGTATAKIAAGLLADSATKIILRQAPDQATIAATNFGLTETETALLSQLIRGRALWKLGSDTALVHHLIAPSEEQFCDTDARIRGD